MTPDEFAARLAALPTEEPDEIDRAMLEEAEAVNDGTAVPLEAFLRELEEHGGKPVLHVPVQSARSAQ